ncbi:hypothetical protein [Streptomyces sp. CFMR 7]|uniref:hypothetical protein n=1 Tax=Streptomyces sp. CFMR 7 TaxID=1649184 RepID=UPI00119C9CBE|nr:hypothetical protein [Streptomyces sp. CFMR 7]
MQNLNEHPTRILPSNRVMPDKGWEQQWPSSGPGWSWMVVFDPWFPAAAARHRWAVFPEHRQAREDLKQVLDEGNVASEQFDPLRLWSFIGLADGDELFMSAVGLWRNALVFSLFRVDSDETAPQAGIEFHNACAASLRENVTYGKGWRKDADWHGRYMVKRRGRWTMC